MRITSLFIFIVIVVAAGCGGTAVQLNIPGKAEIKRKIGKVNFLYASHPAEYINLSESKTAILTDDYWFGFVNNALRKVCDNVSGKQVARKEVIDSFTGQITVQTSGIKANHFM